MLKTLEVDSAAMLGQAAAGGPTPPNQNSTARNGTGRRKRHWKLLLLSILVLVVLVPGSAGVYAYSLAHAYTSQTAILENAFPPESVRIQAPEVPPGVARAVNILVLGSDSRDKTPTAAAKAAAGTASNQRSDAVMLLHIPADRSRLYSISLMRDLWVNIPDHGQAKINAALAYGGVPLVVRTVESLLQQRIDQVVMIDFEVFKGLVDALGGVKLKVKVPFTALRGTERYDFKAGRHPMDGTQALAFVRERYAFPDGDYQRVRNQQLLLTAVLAKIFDTSALSNPAAVRTVLESLGPYMTVAQGLDAMEAVQLALSLRDVEGRDIDAFTLPTAGIGTSTDGQSIVLPDPAAIEEVKAALSADRLGDYVAARIQGNGK